MSRSVKKNSVFKKTDQTYKKLSNRLIRKNAKLSILKYKDIIPLKKELINRYDIYDYKFSVYDKNDKWYKLNKRK